MYNYQYIHNYIERGREGKRERGKGREGGEGRREEREGSWKRKGGKGRGEKGDQIKSNKHHIYMFHRHTCSTFIVFIYFIFYNVNKKQNVG